MDSSVSSNQPSAPGTILRSVTALSIGETLARVVALLATAVLARRLGPEGFGVVGFAVAVCGYLALAVNNGLQELGTREVSRAPERAAAFYSSIATVRLLLACGAFATLALSVGFLPKPPTTRLVVLVTGLSFFSLAIDPTWVLRGLERPILAGSGLVLAQAIYAGAILAAVRGPDDVAVVPVLLFGGELVAGVVLGWVLLRGTRPRFAVTEGIKLLRRSGYLALARALRAIVVTFDVVLLGFLATDRDVGLYIAAYRFTFFLMSVATSIAAAYLPSYARVIAAGAEPTRRLIETSLGISVAIGAPLVAGTIVSAKPLLTLLFGPHYLDATPALRVLALSVGLLFLHWSLGNLLLATHRLRLQATVQGAAAVVNVGLNVLLVPRYGITGAATATLLAELTIVLVGIECLRRMRILPSARILVRPLVATSLMSVVVWLVGPYVPLVIQIALGAGLYIAALAAMGGVPRDVLRQTLRRP